MKSDHENELEQLLSKLAENELRSDDLRRLESLLQGDAALQAKYFDWQSTHILLEQEGAIRSDTERNVQAVDLPRSKKTTPKGTAGSRSEIVNRNGVRYALAAVVLIAVGASLARQSYRAETVSMATVVDAIGVVDGPRELTVEGSVLDVGCPVQFGAGVLSVAMPSGTEFTLEGPATMVVTGSNQVRLDQGRLYAIVPASGVGFTVDTPSGSTIDLGTEFGVAVHAGGRSETFVFAGKVRAESGSTKVALLAGDAVASTVESGLSAVREFNAAEARFTRSINGSDYLDAIDSLGPLYLHRFSPSSKQRSFENSLGGSDYPVSLRGGVYASAGGPIAIPAAADGYLRFVGVESLSEAPSVGNSLADTGQYTILLWARVDGEGSQGLAAFTSERGPDAELGSLLRVTKGGYLEHRCHSAAEGGREHTAQRSESPLPIGAWTQIVASGGSGCDLNLYVNGKRAAAPVRFDSDIRAECGRLVLGSGSDRQMNTGLDTGPLRGAIDELAVFDRRLSAEEVSLLYKKTTHTAKKTPL